MTTNETTLMTVSSGHAKTDVHPVASAIERVAHRARDIKLAARTYMPLAHIIKKESFKEVKAELETYEPLLDNENRKTKVIAFRESSRALRRFWRLKGSDVPSVIEVGLFLSLFAAYDAFIGDLMRALYVRKPALFGAINKELTFKDVLDAESLDMLKEKVLEDEIENLRRKSYSEQFSILEKRFDISTLTRLDSWSAFLECSQRRNLLTHCDGIVSRQYRDKCKEAGIKDREIPPVGTKIGLGSLYFYASCELVLELGVKLGHTLWRKTLPDELAEADRHLMYLLYSALETGNWARAEMLGEFAFNQGDKANERNEKTIIINYAQALKRNDKVEKAAELIKSIDWTATGYEFKLSELVLRERWDEAAGLMREVGSDDQLLSEEAYHLWPLFLEFRETEEFSLAYQDLFGHSYSDKVEQDILSAEKSLQSESDIDESDTQPEPKIGQDGNLQEANPEEA